MSERLILDWAVLAVSFYNTISLLWLGAMVILIGNRKSFGTWLTGGGMLVGALFFTSHSAILGRGINATGFGMNFWWAVSWLPAAAAPLAWYGAMLWHTGFRFERRHPHTAWLALLVAMLAALVVLLVFANPLPRYDYIAGQVMLTTFSIFDIPILILLYLVYSVLSYLLPLDLLRRVPVGPHSRLDQSRQLARPWLAAASLAMFLAGGMLTWTALWALSSPFPSLANADIQQSAKTFDLAVSSLVALAVTLLGRAVVAYEVFTGRTMRRGRFFHQWRSAVLLAGGFGVAAGGALVLELRPISTLLLATLMTTLFYVLFSWRSYAERDAFWLRLRPFVTSQNLYGRLIDPSAHAQPAPPPPLFANLCGDILGVQRALLLPLGPLATLVGPPLVYPQGQALVVPHPAYPAEPQFTSILDLDLFQIPLFARLLIKNQDRILRSKERNPPLFPRARSQRDWALLRSFLRTACGKKHRRRVQTHAGRRAMPAAHIAIRYWLANRDRQRSARRQGANPPGAMAWEECFNPDLRYLAVDGDELAWAVPLWNEQGLGGVLFLGHKENHTPFTEEEIELAQAGGERLLDTLAGSEIARISLDLLRQRLTQARVLEGQGRRVLHDEVLPELHTAILYLSGVACPDPQVKEGIATLSASHRRISNLLRETAAGAPARLAQDGLVAALQDLFNGDLAGEFEQVDWQIAAQAVEKARQAPPYTSEVVYFAARELARNAARYGRGAEPRPLTLTLRLETLGKRLRLVITDDGIGPGDLAASSGAGSGLRIHSAMLAAVGASLEVAARPEGGTRGVILF